MEAVARNQSERIRDESIIEREIEFYLKAPQYVADIKDRLKENELDIQWPMTRFEEGRIYFYSPRTDVQAIKRIEVRDSLAKALERVKERTKRLENALKQLSDDEDGFDLIWLFYFKKMDEYKISRLLGFKSVKDMQKARDKALREIFKIYNKERKAQIQEFEWNARAEGRAWLEQYKKNRMVK